MFMADITTEQLEELENEVIPKADNIKTMKEFESPEYLYKELIASVRKYHPSDDISMIEKAYHVADEAHKGQVRKSGEAYIIHPLCVAIILAELELDKETIVAGLLHDVVEDTVMTVEEITEEFGAEVALLVDGVTKLGQLAYDADKVEVQAENLRKMFLAMAKDGPHHMDIQLSRSKFEELTKDLIERTVIPVENAIHDAGLTKSQIDMVLLVGGSTRIPAVQDKVRTLMGKEPSRNVNPDECVAIGAAVQAGKLGGQLMAGSAASEMILMDVTPLSLSIETVGGVSSRLIERNTTIPTRHSQIFTTAGNFQTSVDIKVFQGERKFTRDNKLLGNFRLSGIKRAMAGTPQIEVTFDIDANGIVNVSAKDLGTGHEQSITITSSSNLSEEEIERAKWEAQMYGRQDEAKTQLLAVRQEAVQFAGQAQAELDSHKKEWERSKKKAVKEILGKLKRTLYKVPPEKITADSAAVIRDLQEELQRALNS